ncbi:hypothetical protein [Rhodococcus erythropolis]|uniref:hypothetical protein n=1 Tax=Rhodococcus erythropolis TaxID=1833 RepID=UPI0002FF8422|nr:hypothetical protein [Rhodococcus erythropolis]
MLSLIAAETAEPGNIRPSALSQYLTRQPSGDDIVAGNNGAHGSSLEYDEAHAAADSGDEDVAQSEADVSADGAADQC